MRASCARCRKEFSLEEVGTKDDKRFIANYCMWDLAFCSQICMDEYEQEEFVKWKQAQEKGEV